MRTVLAKMLWFVAWGSFWSDVSLHIASLFAIVPASLTFEAQLHMVEVTFLGMMPAIGLETTKTGFFAGNFWLARALLGVPWRWRLVFLIIGSYFFLRLYYFVTFDYFESEDASLRLTTSFMSVFAWTSVMYYRAWYKDILSGGSIRQPNQNTPIE